MSKKSKYFWHVGPAMWHQTGPVALGGVANQGPDCIGTIIDTETAVSARPEVDNFVIERLVGQYQLTADEEPGAHHFCHSRVYVAETNAAAVAVRSLNLVDDAETSFLWHQVDPWHANYDAQAWGSWQLGAGSGIPQGTSMMGRYGHIDIRVGRRLEGGEALIWHTQWHPAPAADNTCYVKLWLRALVREG